MATDAQIHFGWFIRQRRKKLGFSLQEMANKIGITNKRLSQLEQLPTPEMASENFGALATALEMTRGELSETWKTTFVEQPSFREAPNAKAVPLSTDAESAARVLNWLVGKGYDHFGEVVSLMGNRMDRIIDKLVAEANARSTKTRWVRQDVKALKPVKADNLPSIGEPAGLQKPTGSE